MYKTFLLSTNAEHCQLFTNERQSVIALWAVGHQYFGGGVQRTQKWRFLCELKTQGMKGSFLK